MVPVSLTPESVRVACSHCGANRKIRWRQYRSFVAHHLEVLCRTCGHWEAIEDSGSRFLDAGPGWGSVGYAFESTAVQSTMERVV